MPKSQIIKDLVEDLVAILLNTAVLMAGIG